MEEIMENLAKQIKQDLVYFKKYGIKSAMLQRVCNQLKIDDEDLKELV